jgi:hypothetical protein
MTLAFCVGNHHSPKAGPVSEHRDFGDIENHSRSDGFALLWLEVVRRIELDDLLEPMTFAYVNQRQDTLCDVLACFPVGICFDLVIVDNCVDSHKQC